MLHSLIARNWFLPALAFTALLALLVPGIGARGGPLRPELTTGIGVGIIFLLHGINIAPAALRAGALLWRLHAVVQLFIFAAFPVLVIALDRLAGGLLPAELRLGFLFLAILPTTIASSVVYTANARGNTTAALFNAALANLAGVLVTPLLAAVLLSARGELPSLGSVVASVALLLLLPFAGGQLIRPLLVRRWQPDGRSIAAVSNLIILFIVFTAFAESVATGAFAATPARATLGVGAGALLLFALATVAAWVLGASLRLRAEDRIALLFCGSQKTLAAGAPMAYILFPGHVGLGVILLPLIVYHAVQLIVGAAFLRPLESWSVNHAGCHRIVAGR